MRWDPWEQRYFRNSQQLWHEKRLDEVSRDVRTRLELVEDHLIKASPSHFAEDASLQL